MKRIFLLICLILPTYAFAQEKPALTLREAWLSPWSHGWSQDIAVNKPALKPAPKEEKAKPVILDAAKLQELRLVTLEQENLALKLERLRAEAEKLQGDAKKADDNITAFWAKLGIKREELATKWEASNGLDGAIILKPKEEAKKN